MKISKKNIGLASLFTVSLVLGVGSTAFVSCDEAEEPEVYEVTKTLPSVGNLRVTKVTESTVSFEWDAVAGAVQYGTEICDLAGNSLTGGTTNTTVGNANGLSLFTEYVINVKAIPALGNGGISESTSLRFRTLFYECLTDIPGRVISYLGNEEGEDWSATLNEDRTAEDYVEGTFGVMTLNKFYNNDKGSLVFTVNSDNKIKILNATGYDENGWAMVSTGRPQSALKTLYIDESASEFDRKGRTLTYMAKLAKSPSPKEEKFYW